MELFAKKNFSICLVSEQLSDGGAERCAALLSIFLEKNNCNVSHLIVIDKVEYVFSGKLYNLGKLKNESNDFFNRLKRFRIMKEIFTTNEFDFIVDFRVKYKPFQEYLITKLIYKSPLILSIRSFRTEWYFPKSKMITKIIYQNVLKITTVANAISTKIEDEYGFTNVQTIYNCIDFDYIESSCNEELDLNFEYALAVGRLVEVKQFDQLIIAYSESVLPTKNIKLVLLGEGELRDTLEKLVIKLCLEELVLFKGKVSNPFKYMKQANVLLLTSKNEGFPNVIIEALACNTPVISFDCPSGPSEIIINNENGILVENQNFEKFIQAMNKLTLDKELYLQLKNNSKKSAIPFSLEKIGNQWLNLFKTLKNESENN